VGIVAKTKKFVAHPIVLRTTNKNMLDVRSKNQGLHIEEVGRAKEKAARTLTAKTGYVKKGKRETGAHGMHSVHSCVEVIN
jgi:hypothetical protein